MQARVLYFLAALGFGYIVWLKHGLIALLVLSAGAVLLVLVVQRNARLRKGRDDRPRQQ